MSPFLAQSMLVRVCEDANTAKYLWENIIRKNFSDSSLKIYPWYLTDATTITTKLTSLEYTRQILSNSKLSISDSHHNLMNDSNIPDLQRHRRKSSCIISADLSETVVNICLSTIQFNFLDSLLGPKMPRFQFNISNLNFSGNMSHHGLTPKISYPSSNLNSKFKGGVTIDSSFFNSIVGSHEPLIEPYTLILSIMTDPKNHSLSIDFKDRGHLMINISSTLMQTLSALVVSLEEINKTNDVDEDDDDDDNNYSDDNYNNDDEYKLPDDLFENHSVVSLSHFLMY